MGDVSQQSSHCWDVSVSEIVLVSELGLSIRGGLHSLVF